MGWLGLGWGGWGWGGMGVGVWVGVGRGSRILQLRTLKIVVSALTSVIFLEPFSNVARTCTALCILV